MSKGNGCSAVARDGAGRFGSWSTKRELEGSSLAKCPTNRSSAKGFRGWHLSCLSTDEPRRQPEIGPHEQFSRTGGNLANVIQYLSEQHPEHLDSIFTRSRERVPRTERVMAEPMPDGRLPLQIEDAPFDAPVMARFASYGTLKALGMLACLVLLHHPEKPPSRRSARLLPLQDPCRAKAGQGSPAPSNDGSARSADEHGPREASGTRPPWTASSTRSSSTRTGLGKSVHPSPRHIDPAVTDRRFGIDGGIRSCQA